MARNNKVKKLVFFTGILHPDILRTLRGPWAEMRSWKTKELNLYLFLLEVGGVFL